MSSYLIVKCNDVELINYSRSSYIYQAFNECLGYSEEWQELNLNTVYSALENLKDSIEAKKFIMAKYQTMLLHLKLYDDIWNATSHIQDLEKEIKELEDACYRVRFIADIMKDNEDKKFLWCFN